MKKYKKILIVIIGVFFCSLLITSNVKGINSISQLSMYDDYSLDNIYTYQLPIYENNYRFLLYNKGNIPASYGSINFIKPSVNSKYGITQTYFNYSSDILDDYSEIYIGHNGYSSSGNYGELFHYKLSKTEIKIDLTVNSENPVNIVNINFNSEGIIEITELEIHLQYRISTNKKDIYNRIDLYVNQSIFYTETFKTFTDTNDITYLYTSDVYVLYNDDSEQQLKGLKTLYLSSDDYMNFFFDYPLFKENIRIWQIPETPIDNLEYWTYISYELTESNINHIEFTENITLFELTLEQIFEFDFQTIEGKPFEAKFYFTSTTIKVSDLGDWTVLWNWLRNAVVWLFNSAFLMIQFILFLLVAGINILFGFLFIQLIIPFMWNILIYWLLYGIMFLLFYAYISLMVVIVIIVSALIPTFAWLFSEGLPAMIYGIIVVLSWIFALLFFVLTLGQGNPVIIQSIIESFLSQIALFFMEAIPLIVKYLPELFSYIAIYFLLIGFGYLKLVYVKAKGYVNRTEELNSSLGAYLMPIDIGYGILSKVKELVIGWI